MPWSDPVPLTRTGLRVLPDVAGVYMLIQNRPYSCYNGSSNILKYGMSRTSLRQELLNHLGPHTCANRIARLGLQTDIVVSVRFDTLLADDAFRAEAKLLRNFERQHWQLPILNSTRGFARGEDIDWTGES